MSRLRLKSSATCEKRDESFGIGLHDALVCAKSPAQALELTALEEFLEGRPRQILFIVHLNQQ